jgi:Tol biopolymer transport system component
MSVNGDDPVQLTSFLIGADRTPTWSHDGKWIAFSHDSASQFNLFVVAADGGTPRRVTSEAGIDYSPSWGSP